jgi:Domain of unknown function (DUF1844)
MEGMDDREVRDRFLLLVEEYRTAAWIGLGKLKNPATGAAERNLDLARHAIDVLGMIEVKTRGNRDDAEERFLRQALADLRINYVEELKVPPPPADSGGAGGPGPGAPEDEAAVPESPTATAEP